MLKKISLKIKNKQIILFGEMHGTKEIPEMLTSFFVDLSKKEDFNIALEVPLEFQKEIDSFLDIGEINILKKMSFFSKEECSDGRNSLEYIRLMQKIHEINLSRDKKIKIFCIDPAASNQDEKERGLAHKVFELSEENKLFAIIGDIHASKKILHMDGVKITPSGYLLFDKVREKMISIRLTPKSRLLSKEEREFNKGFDYVFQISNTTLCSFLS